MPEKERSLQASAALSATQPEQGELASRVRRKRLRWLRPLTILIELILTGGICLSSIVQVFIYRQQLAIAKRLEDVELQKDRPRLILRPTWSEASKRASFIPDKIEVVLASGVATIDSVLPTAVLDIAIQQYPGDRLKFLERGLLPPTYHCLLDLPNTYSNPDIVTLTRTAEWLSLPSQLAKGLIADRSYSISQHIKVGLININGTQDFQYFQISRYGYVVESKEQYTTATNGPSLETIVPYKGMAGFMTLGGNGTSRFCESKMPIISGFEYLNQLQASQSLGKEDSK